MEHVIEALCATHGFAYRHEFLAAGLRDAHIRLAVRAGLIERIRHGTYAPTALLAQMSPEQRHLLLARSVLMKLGGGVALSHHSAAIAHTGVSYGVDLNVVHVTRLDGRSGSTEGGVEHHVGVVVPDADLCVVDGMRTVIAPRAIIESCSRSSVESGMVSASFAIRHGACGIDDLRDRMASHERWPGMLTVRLAVQGAEPACESVGEVRSMHFFATHGIPRPVPQVVLADSEGEFGRGDFGWLDFWHVGEFDGLIKYGRLNPYSSELSGEVLVMEKRREDRVRDLELGVSRWGHIDLAPDRRDDLARRILAGLDRSRRRHRAS